MKTRGLVVMMIALMLSASYAIAEQRQLMLSVPAMQVPVTLTEIGESKMPLSQPVSSGDKAKDSAAKKPAPAKNLALVADKKEKKAAKEAVKTVKNTKVAEKTAVAEKKVDLFSKNVIDKIADRADKPTASAIDKKDFGYKFANCASAAAVGVGIKSQNSTTGGIGGAILISSYYFKKEVTKWDIITSALCGGAGYLLAQAPPNDSAPIVNAGGGGGNNTTLPPDTPPPAGTSTGPVTPPPVPI